MKLQVQIPVPSKKRKSYFSLSFFLIFSKRWLYLLPPVLLFPLLSFFGRV
jgi:hypothetical protein